MSSLIDFIQQNPDEATLITICTFALIVCIAKMVEIMSTSDVVFHDGFFFDAKDVPMRQRVRRALDGLRS